MQGHAWLFTWVLEIQIHVLLLAKKVLKSLEPSLLSLR